MTAIRHENLKPPDFPFDLERCYRAIDFADRVAVIIRPYIDRRGAGFMALIAGAYVANVRLIVDGE